MLFHQVCSIQKFLVKNLFVASESHMSSLKKDLNISRISAYAEETAKILKYSGNPIYLFVCILDLNICLQTQIFFIYMLSVYAAFCLYC